MTDSENDGTGFGNQKGKKAKMRKKQEVGLLIALAAFLLAPAEGQAEILAGKGLPPPVIVIPEKAEMNNYKHAVGEWREYLPKLCGIAPTAGKKAETGGFTVFLAELSGGKPSFVPENAAKTLGSNPKEDAFLIRTLGEKQLLILGKTPRALLYGTDYFLDNYLGVKWFYPGTTGEAVPKRERLVIPDVIDDLQSPFTDFRIAAYTIHDKKDVPWKPEDMVRWQHRNLVAVLPRAHQYRSYKEVANVELPGGGHRTLCNAVPNSLYEKHPEYFPLIDGERVRCTCSAGTWNSKAKRCCSVSSGSSPKQVLTQHAAHAPSIRSKPMQTPSEISNCFFLPLALNMIRHTFFKTIQCSTAKHDCKSSDEKSETKRIVVPG